MVNSHTKCHYNVSSSSLSPLSSSPSITKRTSSSTLSNISSSPSSLDLCKFIVLQIILLLLSSCLVNGLRIGKPSSIPEVCADVSGLTSEQLIACKEQSQAVLAVSEGTRKGISECQQQFSNERWNCTPDATGNMFNKILQRGSRETAFFYAITSSGVVHTLSQTCRSGNLTDCTCDRSRDGKLSSRGWKWGGCSDNIAYAMNFAKKFVDSPDEQALKKRPGDLEAIMNLHNNEAGRLAVARKMELRCRCHGISGSCELKTCWRVLPSFSEVGNYLKAKYENSIKISSKVKRRLQKPGKGKKVKRRVPVDKEDLVHIRKSPNYCVEDQRRGILGTSGRRCNKTSTGPDSCELLCCGRGYNTLLQVKEGRCNCRFHWCCFVTCEKCKPEEIYTCK